MRTARLLMIVTLLSAFRAAAEEGLVVESAARDVITEQERSEVWARIDEAQATLPLPKAGGHPLFRWPTRPTRGFWWPRFSRVSQFVDHNAAHPDQLRDYSCGTRTYDTATGDHKGTDIGNFHDGWNIMAASQVEIVAAAPGTIIQKADGNFDQNCAFNTLAANHVVVQHDDGSIAMYWHMKNGTPTAKSVGERVVAGEYLGVVGSSGNSTGPHLHFEVYDADRKLVDPFAGTCNPTTAESWWQAQAPYASTEVGAVYAASAQPVAQSCANGVLQTPLQRNEKLAFAPGQAIYFVAAVLDQAAGQAVTFRVFRPNGTLWKTYTTTPPASPVTTGWWWYSPGAVEAGAVPGTWTVEAQLGASRVASSFNVTASGAPPANYTDLWWNPAESGWGVNLNHQGDTLFATWFTYDADRSGMWLVMSDARLQGDGSYAGAIYRTTGVPFSQINGAASVSVTPVGNGSFRFASATRGTFAYTVNGLSQQKAIERQVFSSATTCMPAATSRASATNYQDLWWNPNEAGWGVNLTHQGETIFATWFTYDAAGRGQWLVASAAQRQPTGEFRGRLYRTSGTPFAQIGGTTAAGSVTDAGEIIIAFTDGENGRMSYTLDGTTQAKAITRQQFGGTQPLCR